MWQKNPKKLLMQFSIHAMGKLAPEFIKTILDIDRAGFDCDYISERLLMGVTYKNGMLETSAGTRYKGLIIPGSGNMPENVKAHIAVLKAQGAYVFYSVNPSELMKAAKPETIKTQYGLKAIRRKNPTGYHYFIANLKPTDLYTGERYQELAVPFKDALWFNPLNGEITRAKIKDGKIQIELCSGESMILQTFDDAVVAKLPYRAMTPYSIGESASDSFVEHEVHKAIEGPWTLSFVEERPRVAKTFALDSLNLVV